MPYLSGFHVSIISPSKSLYFQGKINVYISRQSATCRTKLRATLIDFICPSRGLCKHIIIIMLNLLANLCLFTHAADSNNNIHLESCLWWPDEWKSYILFVSLLCSPPEKSGNFAAKMLYYQQVTTALSKFASYKTKWMTQKQTKGSTEELSSKLLFCYWKQPLLHDTQSFDAFLI